MKRREVKEEEKERYIHLNAEFQGIGRKDKKAFLSDQCKEIEENNRMGKTIDPFKKIKDTNETFNIKMGTIKGRNGMDLTEAKDIIKKRWQEYTEELYKKDLSRPRHHQMVNTEIRLLIFFAARDGEALYSQQKQAWELTVAQIMNSLLPNED